MGCLSCCCILLLSALILAVLSPPRALAYAPDLINSLPGQPQPVSFRQYAGYVTINAAEGRAFFYYFVEAETSPESSPLTLWLNGGPGCSSVGIGAFTELGPFFSNRDGIVRNEYSWNKYSNMLFVESPVGVGFSYSNTSDNVAHTNDIDTANDNFFFLSNWMDKFPEYKGRNLYIIGQAWAGHYVLQLASSLYSAEKAFGTSRYNLKAIAIGNPALDLMTDFEARITFLWSHGLISYQTVEQLRRYCDWTQETLSSRCHVAIKYMRSEMGSDIQPYDVLSDTCIRSSRPQEITSPTMMTKYMKMIQMVFNQTNLGMDVCILDEVPIYFNRPDVQHALHANITSLPYAWKVCRSMIDRIGNSEPMLPVLKSLLEQGLRILAFSGDQDYFFPFLGTRKVIRRIAKDLALNVTTRYSSWFEGQQVGGWTIGYGGGQLAFATVRGASRQVPTSQPARALQLFKSFIARTPFPSSPQA